MPERDIKPALDDSKKLITTAGTCMFVGETEISRI